MTSKEIVELKEKFNRLMVPENRIFDEIMRVYYLDHHMFLDPTHAEYGVTIEELYDHMKATVGELGNYEGDAEQYAALYTLAMQVNPMDFALGVVKDGMDMQNFIADLLNVLKNSGNTLLLSGADSYLYRMPWIFHDLAEKQITVVLENDMWRKKLTYLFPKGKIISYKELNETKQTFDFIFHMEEKNLARIPLLREHMNETGQMTVLADYQLLVDNDKEHRKVRRYMAEKGMIAEYYDLTIDNREWGLLSVVMKAADNIDFGEARIEGEKVSKYKELSLSMDDFVESDDWNYDLYRYNASIALQTLLGANMLSLEHTVASEYSLIKKEEVRTGQIRFIPQTAWEEDLGLRRDLITEEVISSPTYMKAVKIGDILLSCDRNQIHMAVVHGDDTNMWTSADTFVLRPSSYYTGEYLKLYLEGAIGSLFIDVFRTGKEISLPICRFMRIPLPKTEKNRMTDITELGEKAVKQLSTAGENWRKVKRECVHLMMGQ